MELAVALTFIGLALVVGFCLGGLWILHKAERWLDDLRRGGFR